MNRREFGVSLIALAAPAIFCKKPNVLKFQPVGLVAEDAQLVNQLRWCEEDIARAFNVPVKYLRAGSKP